MMATSSSHDQFSKKLATLRQRAAILSARREHYLQRLRVLNESRARLEISRQDWVAATALITVRLESVDTELGQVDEAFRAISRLARPRAADRAPSNDSDDRCTDDSVK